MKHILCSINETLWNYYIVL